MQYMVFVDSDRCVACQACETACKQENDVPVGAQWIKLMEIEREDSSSGRITVNALPMACYQCAEPYCAEVCPVDAIKKDDRTGIVSVDHDKCIGCRMCLIVCPFGAPQFGKDGHMQKCILCKDCVDRGEIPACVRNCPLEAMHFGTVQEISVKIREKGASKMWPYLLKGIVEPS